MSPDWVSLLLIWFSVFWSLEAMRRAWVRKNREARGNKDLSSPQTPFTDGGPTRFVEHRTSHGGCVRTDARVMVHQGEMVIKPVRSPDTGDVVGYSYLVGGQPYKFANASPLLYCKHCGMSYTTERRCTSCGAPTGDPNVELRK